MGPARNLASSSSHVRQYLESDASAMRLAVDMLWLCDYDPILQQCKTCSVTNLKPGHAQHHIHTL